MASALKASALGLDTLVIEKSKYIGGSAARSGGGVWAPNAPQLLEHGERDDPADLVEYLQNIAPDVDRARHERYVAEIPKVMEFLSEQPRFRNGFSWTKGYSDYHPDRGGSPLGHGVWPEPIDKKLLGEDELRLRPPTPRMRLPRGSWLTSAELHDLLQVRWSGWKGKRMLAILATRILRSRLFGLRMTSAGQSLSTRLYLGLRDAGVPILWEAPLTSLVTDDDGRVAGVEATRDGQTFRIGSRGGVILATGGFDHNPEMRKRYHPEVEPGWSSGSEDNVGD